MDPSHVLISDIGRVIELTSSTAKLAAPSLPARSLWTAMVWVMWAAWCCGTGGIWHRTA